MMNIVQILDSKGKRRVGLVSAEKVILLKKVSRTTELASLALKDGVKLSKAASSLATTATENYAAALKEGRLTEQVVRLEDLPRVQAVAFVNSLRGWVDARLV